jgi:hypothetical protein
VDFGTKKRPPTDLWVKVSLEGRERKLRCGFFAGFTGKKTTKMFFLGPFFPAFGGEGVGGWRFDRRKRVEGERG